MTNSSALSSQTNATLSLEPRSPIKPISTAGVPVWLLARTIIGSSITVLTVSMVVV